jgi:epoxyqueuosine reductase
VLERDWAQAAGLGFTGKNCCTIHPVEGSWLLLATMLVPEPLAYDPVQPIAKTLLAAEVLAGLPPGEDYGVWRVPTAQGDASTLPGTCGRCTRCLDACPTAAFVGPYHLDPQRCISYWTIETQSPIPRELRPYFGNRIFGCDICQEVCPWNQRLPARAPRMPGLAAQTERIAVPLLEGFAPETPYWLDATAFAARFRRSPIRRAKRHGMARNVCVALGNWGDPVAVEPLTLALHDPEPVVRGHAAWALGCVVRRHGHEAARVVLTSALASEGDAWVLEEIRLALT